MEDKNKNNKDPNSNSKVSEVVIPSSSYGNSNSESQEGRIKNKKNDKIVEETGSYEEEGEEESSYEEEGEEESYEEETETENEKTNNQKKGDTVTVTNNNNNLQPTNTISNSKNNPTNTNEKTENETITVTNGNNEEGNTNTNTGEEETTHEEKTGEEESSSEDSETDKEEEKDASTPNINKQLVNSSTEENGIPKTSIINKGKNDNNSNSLNYKNIGSSDDWTSSNSNREKPNYEGVKNEMDAIKEAGFFKEADDDPKRNTARQEDFKKNAGIYDEREKNFDINPDIGKFEPKPPVDEIGALGLGGRRGLDSENM